MPAAGTNCSTAMPRTTAAAAWATSDACTRTTNRWRDSLPAPRSHCHPWQPWCSSTGRWTHRIKEEKLMPAHRNVLAFVMAGGEGARLGPLTANRCKPAVPFNGKHRIVDFVLSNLVNSEIYSVYMLVQYKSQSLIEHVRQTWTMARFMPQHFITCVPPQMINGPQWFQGTADAEYQNIHLIESMKPDIVAVFGADHIYRMDIRQMIDFHIQSDAQASVAT